MTGIPDWNAKEFNAVADKLRDKGLMAVNPADINPPTVPWEICIAQDIKHLLECEDIVMLKGWQQSKGALAEVLFAKLTGIGIFDAYTEQPIEITEQEILKLLLEVCSASTDGT